MSAPAKIHLDPDGSITITSGAGATAVLDKAGNIILTPAAGMQIQLAGIGPAVARIGDIVVDFEDNPIGEISTGSSKVFAAD